MLRKGSAGDNLATWHIAYLILGVLFFVIMYWWVNSYAGHVALLEDFYAKELVRIINDARPGDEVYLDVSPATAIALTKNHMPEQSLFEFDNLHHTVTVHLQAKSGTSYSFFNAVAVREDYRLELINGGVTTNRLHFFIIKPSEVRVP